MIRFTELLEKYLEIRRENPRPVPKGFSKWYRDLKTRHHAVHEARTRRND